MTVDLVLGYVAVVVQLGVWSPERWGKLQPAREVDIFRFPGKDRPIFLRVRRSQTFEGFKKKR